MLRGAVAQCANCLPKLASSSSLAVPCRLIHLAPSLGTQYDERVFRDPIVDAKEPLDPDDDRNFMYIRAMKSDQTPVFYRDRVIDKLIRVCTKDGKKLISRTNVLEALEIVKRRQHSAWKRASAEEKKTIELDPFVIAHKALLNCRPLMKLQGVTRGGTTYQVPFPIEEAEAEFRSMKMLRDVCRQKAAHGDTHFEEIMATEFLAAYKNEGFTVGVKQELHKTCEANRAFAHYRG